MAHVRASCGEGVRTSHPTTCPEDSMATDEIPQPLDPPEGIPGDPLIPPAGPEAAVDAPATGGPTTGSFESTSAPTDVLSSAAATQSDPGSAGRTHDRDGHDDDGGGKVKTAALLAGAAALANKVRQEAPKKVQQLREKRAAGRCVIVTEVDGRMLAIGPYKDEASAEPRAFKVGGAPRLVELVTDAAFFAPEDGSDT